MTISYSNNTDKNIILKPHNTYNNTHKHIFVPKNSIYVGGIILKVDVTNKVKIKN